MFIAYIECSAGASGDMFLGAWLDLGIDQNQWLTLLSRLNLAGYTISTRRVEKNGIGALKVDVNLTDNSGVNHIHDHNYDDGNSHDHSHGNSPHRHLPEIYQIIDSSDLPIQVKQKSKLAFRHLADAEATVHRMTPEQVHFHEVGAVDAIVDIVGAMVGWYLVGMPDCYVSPIEVGAGTVWCQHGLMPVPAPATVLLLTGMPTYSSGIRAETVTPTGAAILKTLCKDGDVPVMKPYKVGYGAGHRDLNVANVLRIQLAEPVTQTVSKHHVPEPIVSDTSNRARSEDSAGTPNCACMIEANIDDMTPEVAAYAITKLVTLGAMDAWLTPIVMKKGRSALQLHVLCKQESRDDFIAHIFRETTTIGVRHYLVEKAILDKQVVEIQTRYGPVKVKVAMSDGTTMNVAPEFEDCRLQAEAHDVPLKEVYRCAISAYEALHQ